MPNAMWRRTALAALASTVGGATTAGFVAVASTAYRQVELDGALAPVWPLVALAAVAAALVAARITTCALAATIALLAKTVGGPAGQATRLALVISPRSLRPVVAVLLAAGVAMAVASPAVSAPASVSGRWPSDVATGTPEAANPRPRLPSPGWQPLADPTRLDPARQAPARQDPARQDPTRQARAEPGGQARPDPGWRPSAPRRVKPGTAPDTGLELVTSGVSRPGAQDGELVVRRGDTLWHLAARSLGPGASATEIAAEWPRWWQANRRTIGVDPDLLVPGTRLTAPALHAHPATETEGYR